MEKRKIELKFTATYNAIVLAGNEDTAMEIIQRDFVTQIKPVMESMGISDVEVNGIEARHTCADCRYFGVCGDPERTEPCKGKETEKCS